MIGQDIEPGIVSTVDSATSLSAADSAPGTPLLVGGADLTNGSADGAEVYAVTSSREAREWFGPEESSHLTRNVLDALGNGGVPVLAVAAPESSTAFDLTTLTSTTGSLSEPVQEKVDSVTATVDSEDLAVRFTIEDIADVTPEAGEVVVNRDTGEFEVDAVPSSSGTLQYTGLDYSAALSAVLRYDGEFDFLASLKTSELTQVNATINQLTTEETTVLGLGVASPMVDPQAFTNGYDTSRLQLVGPGRTELGDSFVGAVAGKRSQIGLTTTLINQRLNLPARPAQSLSRSERGQLINKYVTPLKTLGASAQVKDDLTTVSDENPQEAGYRYGFTRLVVDQLIEQTHDIEDGSVGQFNEPGEANRIQNKLNEKSRGLADSAVIYDLNVTVSFKSPTRLGVSVQADVAEPIRFIENDFTIGGDLL
jgi:hypothetical protein